MRYRLRTLLILLGVMPPLLAATWLTGGKLVWLFPLPALFIIWFLMTLKSQAMDPRTRGDGSGGG